MEIFYSVFQMTLMVAVSITMVAFGGMFAERSGVINIALEGMMIMGAFVGTLFIHFIQTTNVAMNPQVMLLLAMLIAGVVGGITSLLLAVSAVNLKADQTIGGTAINMMAPALVIFLARTLLGAKNISFDTSTFYIRDNWALAKIPVLGDLFFKNTYLTIYVGIFIAVAATITLYKTKFGLRLMACGEHPQAADSVGINVYKMRYAGTIISGVLGGIGGLMYIVCTNSVFSGDVSGFGFLSLAVMIFGQWNPIKIMLSALFFALLRVIANYYIAIPWLNDLGIPSDVYKMLPYIATLVVLAFTSKNSRAPKAEGIPYDKGQR